MKKKVLCVCNQSQCVEFQSCSPTVHFNAPFFLDMQIPGAYFQTAPDAIVYSKTHYSKSMQFSSKWLNGLEFAQPYWTDIDVDDPQDICNHARWVRTGVGLKKVEPFDHGIVYAYDYRMDEIYIYERVQSVDSFNRRSFIYNKVYCGDVHALLTSLEEEEKKRSEWADEYKARQAEVVQKATDRAKDIISKSQRECAFLYDDLRLRQWTLEKLKIAIQETVRDLGYE